MNIYLVVYSIVSTDYITAMVASQGDDYSCDIAHGDGVENRTSELHNTQLLSMTVKAPSKIAAYNHVKELIKGCNVLHVENLSFEETSEEK